MKRNKIEMSETKIILDACCGSRMFWFDKENPLILFADIRDEEHTLCDGRSLKVHPDIVSDFTDMPFLDKSFKLVVLKELIEPTVEIIDTIVPLINIKAV